MTLWRNYYECPCGCVWEDVWGCQCNDKCPECGKEIEPYESEEIECFSCMNQKPDVSPPAATKQTRACDS